MSDQPYKRPIFQQIIMPAIVFVLGQAKTTVAPAGIEDSTV